MTHRIRMTFAKETKGTLVYESPDQGRDPVDRIYIAKWAIKKGAEPKSICVIVTDETVAQNGRVLETF